MADLFARVGIVLVVITLGLPNEFSDTVIDGLHLALVVYGSILSVFVVAQLLDIDLLSAADRG